MGSAEVLDVTLPIKDADALALQLTHVFLEDKFASQVQCLATRGVQCLQPLYMGAYLLMVRLSIPVFCWSYNKS